jgi:hypothetical protein
LWAWRFTPIQHTELPVKTEEPFQCSRDCQADDGSWLAGKRSTRACGLPGLPLVPRKPSADGLIRIRGGINPYMGRYPDKRLDDLVVLGYRNKVGQPLEDPADGCPGAWYRTAFVDSVDKYTRRRIENGARVSNPAFRKAPWQVQAAVMYLEAEQERAIRFVDAIAADRLEARRKKDQQTQRGRPASRRR